MSITLHQGDALAVLRRLPSDSAHCCVTSPPYFGLRDYGVDGQFGLEATPDEYIAHMVEVFREVRRVLKDDGTLWLNIGDSYAGSNQTGGTKSKEGSPGRLQRMFQRGNLATTVPGLKPKDLIGIPWRVAFALQADGWYLRSDIIWHKPNPMPESVTDRPTKSHEYIFLLAKSVRYYFDSNAIKEPSRESGLRKMCGSAWEHYIRTDKSGGRPLPPEVLDKLLSIGWLKKPDPCDCPIEPAGVVLDPFCGSGTTGMAALKHGRQFIGIELNPEYIAIARKRLNDKMPLLAQEELSA